MENSHLADTTSLAGSCWISSSRGRNRKKELEQEKEHLQSAVTEDQEEEDEEDSDEAENGFPPEEVLCLRGTKQDYLMHATLDENKEVDNGGKKETIDNFQRGELEAFIQNLNLAKYTKSLIEEDEPDEKENDNKKRSKFTQGNRMAAMILLIQDDAVYMLQFVETFLNLVKKKESKQQCLLALDTFMNTHYRPSAGALEAAGLQPASFAPTGRAVQRQQGLKR
ncbi:CCAAT/enhancer-binding protein zeta [Microtus ochrogaster]|uniref:CCAAT/enhancer-binding protein zeta n=1 Tax=Microtus ochrogaster TaxID=79684 RepID=A0A8J6GH54_MICOH|nr:CCAAT/enhancer-binding protein zeta [Microtus ochrogaster]